MEVSRQAARPLRVGPVPSPAASRPEAPAPQAAPAKAPAAAYVHDDRRAQAEAKAVGAFFERFPSLGGRQVALFHAYWAAHGTFATHALQGFLYQRTRPTDDQGNPKNDAWRAYAHAVEAGLPAAEVERAFLAAHLAEFEAIKQDPGYQALWARADEGYKRVVLAYDDTLAKAKRDLAAGRDPVAVSRWLFAETNRCLLARRAPWAGFMATGRGVAAMLNPANDLARQIWGSAWAIGKGMLGFTEQDRPAPQRVRLRLTAAEAAALAKETGLPLRAGVQDLTPADFARASVQEPARFDQGQLAPRYPLRFEDLTGPDKLHGDRTMTGLDGVMDAGELAAALRNVHARVRSQLVDDFFTKYPCPEAGILVYSANMLAMNGTYGQSEMFGTLASNIMPVDRAGKPKNALWQAYADAYDQHRATGSPSMQHLETLWFRAHMKDFEVVDTPEFQRQLQAFWRAAEADRAMAPMATYTKAMVGGRQLFEQAARDQRSDEAAFAISLGHFAKTIAGSGSFPFWKEDLHEAWTWATKGRKQAPLDDRGLPTDGEMFRRAATGIGMMTGLRRILTDAARQAIADRATHRPASAMVELAKVLPADQLAKVDPAVVAFYRDPRKFDIAAGVEMADGFSTAFMDTLSFLSCLGEIPDTQKGFEGFPIEQELYKDPQGRTHWDRWVVVDGERKPLFLARFEVKGKQLVETFEVNGKTVALHFDVEPYQGGVRLTLNNGDSSKLAYTSRIVFTTVPDGKGGLETTGAYTCATKTVNGRVEMAITPKA